MYFILLFITLVCAREFRYTVHNVDDAALRECVEKAVDTINRETCVYFDEATDSEGTITFLQSGHCSWQASNKTVHLNANCINDDVCYEVLGRAVDVEQPRRHISTHLNLKFNCTEKCTKQCDNGGVVNEDLCNCECQYGFTGDRCELLAKEHSFTDSSCGVINAEEQGHFALSTFPAPRPKQTFCQWLIKSSDPWSIIELEFDEFDFDNEDLPPGQHCNDIFNVFGAENRHLNMPCDEGKPEKIRSKHNWILVELRSNPYAETSHKGPSIRYTTVRKPANFNVFAEGMSGNSASLVLSITSLLYTLVNLM